MQILNRLNSLVWGMPTILLVLFTGIILSVKTRFFQIRFFKRSLKTFFGKKKQNSPENALSPFAAASTALAGTMGVGNIVGVAGAISLGGPGAVFWMWVSALLSMMVKFAEISLAVRYREKNSDKSYNGGAMYYIKNALPKFFNPLAVAFCLCGVAASFGIGNLTQINTIASSAVQMSRAVFSLSPQNELYIRLAVGVLCAAVCVYVLKNDGRTGAFCEKMMPALTVLYILLTVGAIFANRQNLPDALLSVFKGAFSPKGVTGGAVGSAFVSMRFGIARGVFSNEAGMGTAPTAYAGSEGDELSLGLMGIIEVFIDTVVVCTLTAFAILCTGGIGYGTDLSATLTLNAFKSVYGNVGIFVFCPSVIFFAFSSVVGWGLYSTKFAAFIFGGKSKNIFLLLFILTMIPAAIFRADAVWVISEILNGLMIMPNSFALLWLASEVSDITKSASKK